MVTTIIVSVLGILGTLFAWFFNNKRMLYAELDEIYKKLEEAYAKRDAALAVNDTNALTIVTDDIIKLCQRKATLFQRLEKGIG